MVKLRSLNLKSGDYSDAITKKTNTQKRVFVSLYESYSLLTLSCMKTDIERLSGVSLLRSFRPKKATTLNSDSDGTDVAGVMRCLRARGPSMGNSLSCSLQNLNGSCSLSCSVISLNSLVANVRYSTSSSLIDGVDDCALVRWPFPFPKDDRKLCIEFCFGRVETEMLELVLDAFELTPPCEVFACLLIILISRSIDARSVRSNEMYPIGS